MILKIKTLKRVQCMWPKLPIFFGIELLKIYLIERNVSVFENCQKKLLNHSTLLVTKTSNPATRLFVCCPLFSKFVADYSSKVAIYESCLGLYFLY